MNWYFLNTGINTGRFNMDFDIQLSKSIKPGDAILRLYRWEPYCISLGANQKENSINIEKSFADNIDVVKRPTGGRAVLHAEELTYSCITTLETSKSVRNFYEEINYALKVGLGLYDSAMEKVELENAQTNFQDFYKQKESLICFAASAKSELKYSGKKLVGSAQRKLGKSILQHGSILCGDFHKNIIKYLDFSFDEYEKISEEINTKTIDMGEILNSKIDYDKLSDCIYKGFEKFYGVELINNLPEDYLITERSLQ